VGAPAGAGTDREQEQTQEQEQTGADTGAGASPARSLLNGYGLLQFTPNPKKKSVVPELVKEKKIQDNSTQNNTKKKQVGISSQKTHKLNKNQPHINADTKLKIIQNVNTITK
jgi:hypothetical protein